MTDRPTGFHTPHANLKVFFFHSIESVESRMFNQFIIKDETLPDKSLRSDGSVNFCTCVHSINESFNFYRLIDGAHRGLSTKTEKYFRKYQAGI